MNVTRSCGMKPLDLIGRTYSSVSENEFLIAQAALTLLNSVDPPRSTSFDVAVRETWDRIAGRTRFPESELVASLAAADIALTQTATWQSRNFVPDILRHVVAHHHLLLSTDIGLERYIYSRAIPRGFDLYTFCHMRVR